MLFYAYKKFYALKYEVAVCMKTGRLVWVRGAYPGSYNDQYILQHSGLLNKLDNSFVSYADCAYESTFLRTQYSVVTPLRVRTLGWIPEAGRRAFNKHIRSRRVKVEQTLAKVKAFKATSLIWRHKRELHPLVFGVVSRIVNFDILINPM
jgi:hypothetical protein